jgi:hypothetical protein
MTTSTVDRLVADYLARLDAASVPLPADRRSELLEGIGDHIASARAAGAAADEAAVRTLLDRLGPPEVIVAAAMDDGGAPRADPPMTLRPPGTGLELAAVLLLSAGSLVPVLGWVTGVVLLWSSRRWHTREKLLGTLVVPLGPGGVLAAAAFRPFGRTCSVSVGGPGTALTPSLGPPTMVEPPPPPDLMIPPAPLPDVQTVTETCTGLAVPWPVLVTVLLLTLLAPFVVAVVLYRRARARAALEPPRLVAAGSTPWGGVEVAAVVALGLGGLLLLVPPGWLLAVPAVVVGLVLVWTSPRWTSREKLVSTLLSLTPLVLLLILPLGGLLIAGFAL